MGAAASTELSEDKRKALEALLVNALVSSLATRLPAQDAPTTVGGPLQL